MGLAPALWRGGRVSWDCLDKKEDCQGRCGEETARHAIFNGGTEVRRGWICFSFEFWCLPPCPSWINGE